VLSEAASKGQLDVVLQLWLIGFLPCGMRMNYGCASLGTPHMARTAAINVTVASSASSSPEVPTKSFKLSRNSLIHGYLKAPILRRFAYQDRILPHCLQWKFPIRRNSVPTAQNSEGDILPGGADTAPFLQSPQPRTSSAGVELGTELGGSPCRVIMVFLFARVAQRPTRSVRL